jgi:hypothetical protein
LRVKIIFVGWLPYTRVRARIIVVVYLRAQHVAFRTLGQRFALGFNINELLVELHDSSQIGFVLAAGGAHVRTLMG